MQQLENKTYSAAKGEAANKTRGPELGIPPRYRVPGGLVVRTKYQFFVGLLKRLSRSLARQQGERQLPRRTAWIAAVLFVA